MPEGKERTPVNLGFLASHNGSNMQAIIDACAAGRLRARPVVVISNNADSGALARARNCGIPAFHLGSRRYPDADELDRAIADKLLEHDVQLLILAGFMKRLGPHTLARFAGRVVNIHPALLPAYGGRGMYGSRVHEAVIAAGEKETGISVHLVDDQYDTGPMIAERRVPVLPGETAAQLAARLLPMEHELYVETIRRIIAGEIAACMPAPGAGA